MPDAIFDPLLNPEAWFDPQLDAQQWFDADFEALDAPPTPAVKLWRIKSASSCTGSMWGEQLEIGDYTHFGFAIDPQTGIEYLIVHDAAASPKVWKCLRKRPADAEFEERGEIVAVETGFMAGLEVDASSQHRLVATIRTADAIERFYSQDGGMTWKD